MFGKLHYNKIHMFEVISVLLPKIFLLLMHFTYFSIFLFNQNSTYRTNFHSLSGEMERWCCVEAKSFVFMVVEGASVVRLEERRRNFSGLVLLGAQSVG
jgi:hypothetical protein